MTHVGSRLCGGKNKKCFDRYFQLNLPRITNIIQHSYQTSIQYPRAVTVERKLWKCVFLASVAIVAVDVDLPAEMDLDIPCRE